MERCLHNLAIWGLLGDIGVRRRAEVLTMKYRRDVICLGFQQSDWVSETIKNHHYHSKPANVPAT